MLAITQEVEVGSEAGSEVPSVSSIDLITENADFISLE